MEIARNKISGDVIERLRGLHKDDLKTVFTVYQNQLKDEIFITPDEELVLLKQKLIATVEILNKFNRLLFDKNEKV